MNIKIVSALVLVAATVLAVQAVAQEEISEEDLREKMEAAIEENRSRGITIQLNEETEKPDSNTSRGIIYSNARDEPRPLYDEAFIETSVDKDEADQTDVAGFGLDEDAVLFQINQHNLTTRSRQNLDVFADVLNELFSVPDNQQLMILISGHTDASGSDQYNMTLSEKRARAVKDYLVLVGVQADKIITLGRGEKDLLTGFDKYSPRHRRVQINPVDMN